MQTRRQFIKTLAGATAMCGIPWQLARAVPAGSAKRFIFVFVNGGWDPTHVFAPLFGNPKIDLERDATTATFGNIPIVDHASRPSVRTFFERWHSQSVIINGLNVRSVSHEICTVRLLTGNPSGQTSDWATHLAAAQASDFTIPHLVLNAPVFVGEHSDKVTATGTSGQLKNLVSGSIHQMHDNHHGHPSPITESLVDAYLSRRASAYAAQHANSPSAPVISGLQKSVERAAGLKNRRNDINLQPGETMAAQARTAIDALSLGLSRCVTLAHNSFWDTHTDNSQQQALFEDLFEGLNIMMDQLNNRAGPDGPLADDTVLVVLSEMGRTPKLNGANGKDHWPYTSALLVGPGLAGNHVVGGYDASYNGERVDLQSGDVSTSGVGIASENLGATLLALANVDPAPIVPGYDPIQGVLA